VKLVVGLGNIGDEYADTPHNAGFRVVDELSLLTECALRRSLSFRVLAGKVELAGEEAMLVKPLTFMNLSGMAVAAVMSYRKIDVADLLVIVDDADIELGRIRIRKNGSSGGHKGIDSIIGSIGSQDFPRVRIGIGRSGENGGGLVSHVLKPLKGEELKIFNKVIKETAKAVIDIYKAGIDATMNRYNGSVMAA
jgi:peptidyl-tRNA hydrolase, PTH1 family